MPHPVDEEVGRRVRLRRMVLGISQQQLASQLGLTFQQVQKYEKGANRIGASRLADIAAILDVHPGYFFGEIDLPTNEVSGLPDLSTKDVEFLNGYALLPKPVKIQIRGLVNALKSQFS